MKLKTFNTVKFVVSMSTSMKMPIKNYMKKICKNTLELRFFAKFHLFQKVFIYPVFAKIHEKNTI